MLKLVNIKKNDTMFDVLHERGYKTYVIWPFEWVDTTWKYSKIFPEVTKVLPLKNISQNVIRNDKRNLKPDEEIAQKSINNIYNTIQQINCKNQNYFIWLHLPHVIKGRTAYGSDIDIFDLLVGKIKNIIEVDSIYISADHGHMNLDKSIPVYGFHPYEGTIRIPLITPRINNLELVDFPTSNIQLKDIIMNQKIEKLPYVYSDTQYYLQENRKLAIIKDNFKYIYNKRNRTEELYDVDYDPNENLNLLIDRWFDRNRLGYYKTSEIYYYPSWDKVEDIYKELKAEKDRIWREGKWYQETLYKLYNFKKKGLRNIYNRYKGGKRRKGSYGSKVKNLKYEI